MSVALLYALLAPEGRQAILQSPQPADHAGTAAHEAAALLADHQDALCAQCLLACSN